MKARAIACFAVRAGSIRLRVRLLPTSRDVDAEYRAGRRRRNGLWIHAFFAPAAAGAKTVGTVVLPADGRLLELVPHEVAHAVVQHEHSVNAIDDERAATAIGLLSARIFRQLTRRGGITL